MKVKELSDLPLPQIIEALDYEKILAALKSDFKARWPDYSAFLESDPAIKLLEDIGSIEHARQFALDYAKRAKDLLSCLKDSEEKEMLREMVDYAVGREL